MKITIMYLMIIVISLTIVMLFKEKEKAINLLGKIKVIASLVMTIFLLIINYILKNNINFINISIFSNYLFKEYLKIFIYLFIIGFIEIIISNIIKKNYRK